MSAEGWGIGGMAVWAGVVACSGSLPGDVLCRRSAAAAHRDVQNSQATSPDQPAAECPISPVTAKNCVRFARIVGRAGWGVGVDAPRPRVAMLQETQGVGQHRVAIGRPRKAVVCEGVVA